MSSPESSIESVKVKFVKFVKSESVIIPSSSSLSSPPSSLNLSSIEFVELSPSSSH